MAFGSFTKSNNEDIAAASPEICYLIILLSEISIDPMGQVAISYEPMQRF